MSTNGDVLRALGSPKRGEKIEYVCSVITILRKITFGEGG